jgi:predicted O-methyltransferase YrrM
MTEKLEKYILDHTSPENPVLADLSRETEHKVLLSRMLSGHLQGKVLEMFVKMIKPENILEIGSYTGYSAICMAYGLRDGGLIHTIEKNDELETFIRKYIQKSGMENRIKLHIGDAKEIIPHLTENFDLVFIDGDKREYLCYYKLIIEKTKKGGFIIADNVLWNGKVIQALHGNDEYTAGIIEFNEFVHQDPRVENVIIPIRDGIMLLRKL